jgi:hypothetical protein
VVVDGRHYYPSPSTYYGEEQHHHVGTSSYSSFQRYQPHEQHQQRREDQADHTSYYPTNQAPSTSAEPPEAMVEQKTKPKRRRKPQKPGLTAKVRVSLLGCSVHLMVFPPVLSETVSVLSL